jgi:hypothetical protein
MMGGEAFISLKVCCCRRESAKQPEIRLATLLKILRISRCGREADAEDTPWLREVQLSAGYG